MKEKSNPYRVNLITTGSILFSLILFWVVLLFKLPVSFSQYFHSYSLGFFLIVLVLYYLAFRLPSRFQVLVCLGLTMLLFSLPLSYLWTSGFSDNNIIGGLLPYKDGKYYYLGANLILNGLPVVDANQATERPLFPGFLSSVLFLTGNNLKISIALIAQLMGVGLYSAARQIKSKLGVPAASFYAALLYFYIKPWIGNTMSETLGFAVGCFGFSLICLTLYKLKWHDLLLGLIVLVLAISARAGTFFIFPLLALWIGWVMRAEKKFSLKSAGVTLLVVLMGYFLFNSVYARFLGIEPGAVFGNFSYALYGQVRGGTGWHSAVAELGTRNPAIVYRAAWEFFLDHPLSLFIGFVKAYRDFFLIGEQGIFPFLVNGQYAWLNIFLWLGTVSFLILGLVRLFKDRHSDLSALWLAGFIGIFLSIPFLPPVDGGTRFYASTVPFFFTIPAVGVSWLSKDFQLDAPAVDDSQAELSMLRLISLMAITLAFFLPLVIRFLSSKPALVNFPVCSSEQQPFLAKFPLGSYIDLIPAGTSPCGSIPDVCLNDFGTNNIEMSTDDFYQEIFRMTADTGTSTRIIPAIDLVAEKFHYFYVPHDKLPAGSLPNLVSGCGVEISTRTQSIFQVQSIFLK